MTETIDYRIRIMVAATTIPSIVSRVRGQLHHTKWRACSRVGVSVTSCTNKWVNQNGFVINLRILEWFFEFYHDPNHLIVLIFQCSLSGKKAKFPIKPKTQKRNILFIFKYLKPQQHPISQRQKLAILKF